jgi:two-component system sensor histidine kinase CpxA
MKSVSVKIALWSATVLAASFVIFLLIARILTAFSQAPPMDAMESFNKMALREAVRVYETQGSQALSSFLEHTHRPRGMHFYLTDAQGRDLASGDDRSAMLRGTLGKQHTNQAVEKRLGGFISATSSDDRKYVWIVAGLDQQVAIYWPFYVLVCASIVIISWIITQKVALPFQRLAEVVDRFGHGDFEARSDLQSNDEIGTLARSFNSMADRISALFVAERQLLQDISHELRSPLARLTFEAELVRHTKDRDATATRLRREIQRLSELVCDLIDMSRAEGDLGSVRFSEVCLHELLIRIMDGCAIEAAQKQCSVVAGTVDPVTLSGNEELLRRAIENVIRNAIRYTPQGTSVEVELHLLDNRIEIRVRDFGPGIPAHLAERVFDPFYRVDAARSENNGGVGLGLAIARRAIRLHQGDITVESASPGALFIITLPAPSRSRRHQSEPASD